MFDRFTDRARKVMDRAWKDARRRGHDYIGTEHVVLALLDDDGVAGDILTALRVDRATLREEVETRIEPGGDPLPERRLPFTPATRRALELALAESNCLHHDYIGTEHILVGLLWEEEGIGAAVLAAAGVRVDEVAKHLPPGTPSRRPDPPADAWRHAWHAERTRKTMGLAWREAAHRGHESIDTGHALLGLLREEDGIVARIFVKLGVDPARVQAEVERRMPRGEAAPPRVTKLPFTPGMKRALELSLEEGRGTGCIGEEHLLLGLLREEKGTAARVLASLGLDPETVRKAIAGPPAPPD